MAKQILILTGLILFAAAGAQAQEAWYEQNSGTTRPMFDIHFVDQDNGWAVGLFTVLHTTNGGNSWTEQFVPPSTPYLTSVHFVDTMHGWAAGDGGRIARTVDGGETWEQLDSGTSYALNDVYFTDALNGWVAGGKPYEFTAPRRVILHTDDGGDSWYYQVSQYDEYPIKGIHFADALHGCAVGQAGGIVYTSDGGSTWTEQNSGTNLELEDVYVHDAHIAWVVGRDGTILHTVNSGTTWTPQDAGYAYWLTGVSFVDANTGWACGGSDLNGAILGTVDGGLNWTVETSGDFPSFYGIHFVDAENGWASAYQGAIVHTSPLPPETVGANLGCLPTSGTLPFSSTIAVDITNLTQFNRAVAGTMSVTLGSGAHFSNYRSGSMNLSADETFEIGWRQQFPANFALEGDNVFTLLAVDVTTAPYNQPPYPAAGDSDIDTCTVTGIVP